MSYLLIRVHSYTCDANGCHSEEEHAEPRKADADRIMRRQGWALIPGGIYCPAHGPGRSS